MLEPLMCLQLELPGAMINLRGTIHKHALAHAARLVRWKQCKDLLHFADSANIQDSSDPANIQTLYVIECISFIAHLTTRCIFVDMTVHIDLDIKLLTPKQCVRRIADDLANLLGPALFKMTRLFVYMVACIHIAACVYLRVKLETDRVSICPLAIARQYCGIFVVLKAQI
jgi:hypothetical protein